MYCSKSSIIGSHRTRHIIFAFMPLHFNDVEMNEISWSHLILPSDDVTHFTDNNADNLFRFLVSSFYSPTHQAVDVAFVCHFGDWLTATGNNLLVASEASSWNKDDLTTADMPSVEVILG